MNFEFDEETMTFLNLTQIQKTELRLEIEDIVLHGKINNDSIYMNAWMNRYCTSMTNNRLLWISTCYPQRALLSIIGLPEFSLNVIETKPQVPVSVISSRRFFNKENYTDALNIYQQYAMESHGAEVNSPFSRWLASRIEEKWEVLS